MKKIICGIIAITILITGIVCMPTISAATKTKEETNATLRAYTDDTLIGDIDNDGEITIDDATVGQQMIAQFLEFPVQRVKSISNITRPDQEIIIRVFDANCNGMIDIRDVTEIQQYLAEIQQGIYVTEKIYKKTVGQRYGSLPQYQGENVQDTTYNSAYTACCNRTHYNRSNRTYNSSCTCYPDNNERNNCGRSLHIPRRRKMGTARIL